jgi:hypothetical protein
MSFLNYFWSDPRLEHVSSAAAAGFINASSLTPRFLRVDASAELRAWASAVVDDADEPESKPVAVPAEFAGELLALPTLTFLPGVVEWAIGSQSLEFVKWLHGVRPSLFYKAELSASSALASSHIRRRAGRSGARSKFCVSSVRFAVSVA